MLRPISTTALVACLVSMGGAGGGFAQDRPGSDSSIIENTVSDSDAGVPVLLETMQRLLVQRDEFSKRGRLIEDEQNRAEHFRNFPNIEPELTKLVELEQQYRGTLTGRMALLHLATLARSYSGVDRPVHRALAKVVPHLEHYGHSRDVMLIVQRVTNNDSMAILSALDRLIANDRTLPEVVEHAELARARWMLQMSEKHEFYSEMLETKSGSENRQSIRRVLERLPDAEKVAEWRASALNELTELSHSESGHRMVSSKNLVRMGLVCTEDADRTIKNPTIAELASGLLFKEQYLRIGKNAPDLEVELLSGETWSLRDQDADVVLVQFSFKGCGPCERMYPVLRELSEKHPDRVSVLTIMTDESIQISREAAKSGKMSWNVTWDGKRGPISSRWAVRSFPSTFIFGPDKTLVNSDISAEYVSQVVEAYLLVP